MKPYHSLLLIGIVFLSSCSLTPVKYGVTKTVKGRTSLLPKQLPLGITEEIISPNEVIITAKLGPLSSHKRSTSMAFYHSAKMAQSAGHSHFRVLGKLTPSWCRFSKSKYNLKPQAQDGGPTTKLHVKFFTNDTGSSSGRTFSVAQVLAKYKDSVFVVPDQEDLKRIKAERMEHCQSRAKLRH